MMKSFLFIIISGIIMIVITLKYKIPEKYAWLYTAGFTVGVISQLLK